MRMAEVDFVDMMILYILKNLHKVFLTLVSWCGKVDNFVKFDVKREWCGKDEIELLSFMIIKKSIFVIFNHS